MSKRAESAPFRRADIRPVRTRPKNSRTRSNRSLYRTVREPSLTAAMPGSGWVRQRRRWIGDRPVDHARCTGRSKGAHCGLSSLPLTRRKELLEPMVTNKAGVQFNGHDTGDGELILKHAGKLGFEGVVSKTFDAPYAPGNRGLWRKSKWLNRQEFVIVGWSDPEGSRPHLGALLLGYYTDDGRLIYAGRVGTGMPVKVLADLRHRLQPLARTTSPLSVPPSRKTRFGSPLVLSRVHWVEPVPVAEIKYLTWTADNLLRHTVYIGLREDKPAGQVRQDVARG